MRTLKPGSLTIFAFLLFIKMSYAQNSNDCYFQYAFGEGTLSSKMSIWKTESKKIWKHGLNTEQPALNDSGIVWQPLYESSLQDMWRLGLSQIEYEDNGLYSCVGGGTPGACAPDADNGVNQFDIGWWNNPDAGGVTVRSGEQGSRLHTTVLNGAADNIMLHDEVDILMNVDNVGPNWSWGLPNGFDRETAIRHELGHSYGITHADWPAHTGAPLMRSCATNPDPNCDLQGEVFHPDDDQCIDRYVDCVYDISPSLCGGGSSGIEFVTPIYFSNMIALCRDNQVTIHLQTEQQIGWLGFDILRNEKGSRDFQKVNSETIETVGDELTGATYEFLDETADPTKSYLYVIRIHTIDGIIEEEPFFYEGEETTTEKNDAQTEK